MNRIHYLFLIVFAIFACQPEQPGIEWTHYYEATQCADPWDQHAENDVLAENVEAYLNENQIEIEKIRIVVFNPGAVCLACNCGSGKRIEVVADDENGEKLLELEMGGSANMKWQAY